MEDSRINALRGLRNDIADRQDDGWEQDYNVIDAALAYMDERLRINAGLVGENAALRAKMKQPEVIDLTEINTRDLLAEVARRMEDM